MESVRRPEFARVIRNAFLHSGYSGILRTELNRFLQNHDKGGYTDPVAIASYYAELGDQHNTLQWLEKGYQEHSSSMQFLAVSSSFDAIRSSAQFQYWLNVVGLPSVRITTRGTQN